MIDPSTLGGFTDDVRVELSRAFALIGDTGVVLAQIERESQGFTVGDSDQSIEELAKELLKLRQKIQQLQLFHNFCVQTGKEMTNGTV